MTSIQGMRLVLPRADTTSTTSKYDVTDHANSGPLLLRIDIAILVLVTIVMGLRIFTRLKLIRHFEMEDILMVSAYVFFLGEVIAGGIGVSRGLGRHLWTLGTSNILAKLNSIILMITIRSCFYATALALAKSSIIALYFRLFPHNPVFRRFMYAVVFAVIGQWISTIILIAYLARPISASHIDANHYDGVDIPTFGDVNAAITIATDVILCTVPLPIFWKLNMPRRDRIVVCVLFLLGGLASTASILRLYELTQVDFVDYTFTIIPSLYWTTVEVGIAIITSSIPSLKPLFVKVWNENGAYIKQSLKSLTTATANGTNHTAANGRELRICNQIDNNYQDTRNLTTDHRMNCMSSTRGLGADDDDQHPIPTTSLKHLDLYHHNNTTPQTHPNTNPPPLPRTRTTSSSSPTFSQAPTPITDKFGATALTINETGPAPTHLPRNPATDQSVTDDDEESLNELSESLSLSARRSADERSETELVGRDGMI